MGSRNGIGEPSITLQFTTFFAELKLSSVPSTLRQTASSLILDTLCCLRAGTDTTKAQQVIDVSSMFGGPSKASLAGAAGLVGTAQALYVNARLSNLLDWDETFPTGAHFGGAAVCAAIVGCETRQHKTQKSPSGADLLLAVIGGYEAAARVASAIGPIFKVQDGEVQDYAKVWGVAAPVVIAACVAYALASNSSIGVESLAQALGIAVSNIPLPIGNKWSEFADVADCKYCDAGWCAVTGMHGVVSAMAGLTGFADVLDGKAGLPEACNATTPRTELLTEQLGQLWYLADITFKPWPTCRWMHAPQTALDRLLKRYRPAPEEIKEVIIHVGPVSCGSLFEDLPRSTFCSYSFSYHHAIAMMLMNIPPGPKWFEIKNKKSKSAVALAKKIRIEQLEGGGSFARYMIRNQIRTMPGAATIKTVDGQEWREHCEYSDGDPWDQCTSYDQRKVIEKFRRSADSQHSEKLLSWIMNIETSSTLEPLTMYIRHCVDVPEEST